MTILQEAYDYVKSNLKESRFIHTLGVVSVAKKLAVLNDVSEEEAEIAALCHDIAKNLTLDEYKELILQNDVVLTDDEKNTPELWHSIVGPIVTKKVFNIDNEDILNAIRYHTTGRENMTKLEKIIYIADMIEPSRVFDGVERLREETLKSLDRGVYLGLTHTIKYLVEKEKPVDINSVKARNFLIFNGK